MAGRKTSSHAPWVKWLSAAAAVVAVAAVGALALLPGKATPSTDTEPTTQGLFVPDRSETGHALTVRLTAETEELELKPGVEVTLAEGYFAVAQLDPDENEGEIGVNMTYTSSRFGVSGEGIQSVTYSSARSQFLWDNAVFTEKVRFEKEAQGLEWEDVDWGPVGVIEKSVVVGDKELYCPLSMMEGSSITIGDIFDPETYEVMKERYSPEKAQSMWFGAFWRPPYETCKALEELSKEEAPDLSVLPGDTITIDVTFTDGSTESHTVALRFTSDGSLIAVLDPQSI